MIYLIKLKAFHGILRGFNALKIECCFVMLFPLFRKNQFKINHSPYNKLFERLEVHKKYRLLKQQT